MCSNSNLPSTESIYNTNQINVNDNWQQQGVVESVLPASWRQLKTQMKYPESWLSGRYADFKDWQHHARQLLRQSFLTPDSTKPFDAQTLASEDRGTYTAEKIALNITDDNRIAALMLTPKTSGPHPAIVVLHDHGSRFDIGKEKLIRPWGKPEQLTIAQAWADKFFSGYFIGDELAKRGYAVIAIDCPGWSDRGPMTYKQQQALASNYFNLGRSLSGEIAYEDIRTVDFLASRENIDSQRIGVLGFSMGGFRAAQLAALSGKVAATAIISLFGTYDGMIQPGNYVLHGQLAFYMLHPGMPAKMDIPDIASIYAPKPMLAFSGARDNLFPEYSVNDAFAKAHKVWASQNADDMLVTKLWPELGHVFARQQQEEVFPWFDKWLKP